MKKWIYSLLVTALPTVCSGQVTPPALGATSSFALFTAVGAFDNVGPSVVHGDIGTNAGAFSGFPLGVVFGNIHVADTYSTQAATDVQNAFGQLSTIPCVVPLGVLGGTGGNPQVLTPNAYCLGGATTFAGELILDAQGDPNAVFFIRVSGALTTGEGSVVTLINGASLNNVYWQVTGRVDLGHNSIFQGTLVVDGAINLIEGTTLLGRGLSRTGAITMDASTVNAPVLTSTAWLSSNTGTLASRKDWFLASNWSNGVPTALLDAVILSGRPNYPLVTSGTPVMNGLTLGTSASLIQNGGTLEIHGDFSNSGTFTMGGGTVELAGATSQLVGGSSTSQFWNLTVGLAGASLTGPAQVKRVLKLNGNLLTSSRPLTLLSDLNGSAMVVNTGGVVMGSTTVQRYLTTAANAGLGYRHMSSPVVSTTVNDLTTAGYTAKVNPAYNALPTPNMTAANFPNIFGFDETRGGASNQNFADGYFSPASVESPLVSGRGYSVYIKGGLKPDFVGELRSGDLVMTNLTRTGNGGKAGWHLLGNPYPAPLDWDLVTVPVGMSNAISVFKTTGVNQAGVYLTRVSDGLGNGTGTLTDGHLAMGQGFFAQVTGAGPVDFTFPQAARVTDYANPAHFRPAPETRPMLTLTVRQQQETAPEAQGATQIYFTTGATTVGPDAFDGASPARNIGIPTLVTLANAAELAVNGLPLTSLSAGISVPLLLDLPTAGVYTLAVPQLRNLAGQDVFLVDQLSHTRYDLAQQPTVTFTANRAGEDRTRFTLELGRQARSGSSLTATKATLAIYPNPTAGHEVRVMLSNPTGSQLVELLDATGRQVRTTYSAADGTAVLPVTGLTVGVYTVRAAAATQRLLIK
jgi:Ice-binding-like